MSPLGCSCIVLLISLGLVVFGMIIKGGKK